MPGNVALVSSDQTPDEPPEQAQRPSADGPADATGEPPADGRSEPPPDQTQPQPPGATPDLPPDATQELPPDVAGEAGTAGEPPDATRQFPADVAGEAGTAGEPPDATREFPADVAGELSDETRELSSDETRELSADQTQPLPSDGDATAPIAPAWAGRAPVRPPGPPADAGLSDTREWDAVSRERRRWGLPVVFVLLTLILLGVLGFGVWLIAESLSDEEPAARPSPSVTAPDSPSRASEPPRTGAGTVVPPPPPEPSPSPEPPPTEPTPPSPPSPPSPPDTPDESVAPPTED